MKNKLIILIVIIISLIGLSNEYNSFIFDKKGFSINMDIPLKTELDIDFLYSKDILINKNLFLNYNSSKYTESATNLFTENMETELNRKISLNYYWGLMSFEEFMLSDHYLATGVIIKNEGLFKKITEFQGMNHEIEIDFAIPKYYENIFKDNYNELLVSVHQGFGYDFKEMWTYTKVKSHLELNKEFYGIYFRPKNNFETVLFESNSEKEYYLPKISLKNSEYNLSVNNYLNNQLEVGYAIESELVLPMKTRIGVFGETMFYSEKIKDIFTENLNGFAGINLTHTITEKERPSLFEIEIGAGKYFTKTTLSEQIVPYFSLKFNLVFIGSIIRMF
jgi:hypothetical protein